MWESRRKKLKEELENQIRTLERKLKGIDQEKLREYGFLDSGEDEPKIRLKYLGREISISLPQMKMNINDGKRVDKPLRLIVLKYLLGREFLQKRSDPVDLSEMGVDYSSFAKKIGRLFYMRGSDFLRSLEGLGGNLISGRESKIELEILPKFSLFFTFDEGYEERPSRLKVECGRECFSVFGAREVSYILQSVYSEIVKRAKELYSE